MKDVIIQTDPRNELIGLCSLCFYLEETFTISLTCLQGLKCTQPLTSQLVNECSLFFCQTTPTSGDKIEQGRQGMLHVSAYILIYTLTTCILHKAKLWYAP